MKNLTSTLLATLLTFTAATATANEVVRIDTITPEMLITSRDHTILECPAGTSLPLQLMLQGDFFTLESSDDAAYTLHIVETCYMRLTDDNILFSVDMESWKEFQDFFTGSFGVAFSTDDADRTIRLRLEMNQR